MPTVCILALLIVRCQRQVRSVQECVQDWTRMHQPNQCVAVLLGARGSGGWLRANMVRWQLETRIKVQPFVPHSRSEKNDNIELGATRYFSRHAWWSKWSF